MDLPARVPRRSTFSALLERDFFPFMALLVGAIVVYGFGRNLNAKLIHPPFPRPAILYVHVAMFTGWVLLFATQAALVYRGNVRLHRKIGAFGLALGAAMPVVGVLTAIAMARLNLQHGDAGAPRFLIFPIFYMIAFAAFVGLAGYFRKRPEFHRRLMLVATCTLTVAAFARFPRLPIGSWDVCVDALILLAVVRDVLLTRSVHPVYRYGLPILAAGQALAVYTYAVASPWWLAAGHALMA